MAFQGLRLIITNVMGCRNTTYTLWPISSPRWPAPHLIPGQPSIGRKLGEQPTLHRYQRERTTGKDHPAFGIVDCQIAQHVGLFGLAVRELWWDHTAVSTPLATHSRLLHI